ncbi:MAG TPA: hypothetical protein EYQ40_09605, partial [Candidatus Marinimicrobia bacterium]|nr:hypothetical protein [Candidatus Neomarinimicrobiota bacterium]
MKRMLAFLLSALMITAISADDYNPGADFNIENTLMFHGDANFADFSVLGAQSVMAGMDFDGDSLSEILFTMDETLPPGGPDPGNVGIYLYESDGNGGYDYVWHFVSPDPGNSLPGMFHGDIDGDGSHEIYFGVPPALGSNDDTWGTYIFEQGTNGMFPTTATHLLRYGMETTDNFRPAGYAMADIDGDGKTELATVDRGGRRLSIDALTGDALDDLASFTNEFMDVDNLAGGGVYDVDIADTDMDGRPEVWVNTWDNFSFAIFEATGANTYALAADLNGLFPDNDPGSFNSTGFAFKDVDGDDDIDAWFPMTNGKLYYFDNPALDSISPNVITNGGVENGSTGWEFYPNADSVSVVSNGDTLLYETSTSVVPDVNGADSTVYDTTAIFFAASAGENALAIHGGPATGTENNAFVSYSDLAAGSQFYASAHVLTGHPADTYAADHDGLAVLFAKFFDSGWSMVHVDSDTLDVTSTAGASNSWTQLDIFSTVPQGVAVVQVGVMYVQPTAADNGIIYVDELEMSPVVGNGVAGITAADFSEVLTFGGNSCRGADMGDIDGDSKPDMIVGTGTNETVVWIEYVGNDPTDPADYMMATILSSQGGALDRYYPLDISDTDLDGDGNNEVVITNLFSTEPSQPQIIVLEHTSFSWDWEGGNEDYHLAPNWSIAAIGEKSINDSLFQSDPTGNSRTVIGGMDMDMDGKHEVIATDYAGGRVVVYEMDMANNAFDVVWSSPVVEARNHVYNPRTVNVGDLDGDGKQEIVFPSSNVDAEGYHIYEWDGVEGSDNYGEQPSAICAVEVAICCGDDGSGFRGDHERLTIFDIDGDGRQELITAIRRGSPRGALVVSLSPNDDLVHNSGGGLETWVTEFQTNSNTYGGGSPYHALPADLNGDGNYEVVNHHWNYFNLYNFSATGPDTYVIADSGAAGSYYQPTYPSDEFSLFGGYASDVDGDGNDEVYYADYGGSWSVNAGDIYVVDYDAGEDVTTIGPDQVHRIGNAGSFSGDIGSGYDGHDNPYIFSSRSRPNVSALEYIGPDPSLGSSYLEKVIYWGELDVTENKTTTDETGAVTEIRSYRWGYPSKIQTRWGDDQLDFDGDNKNE